MSDWGFVTEDGTVMEVISSHTVHIWMDPNGEWHREEWDGPSTSEGS